MEEIMGNKDTWSKISSRVSLFIEFQGQPMSLYIFKLKRAKNSLLPSNCMDLF